MTHDTEFERGSGLLTADEFARWVAWRGLRANRKPIEHGVQFTLSNKHKVNIYHTGRVLVHGGDEAFRQEVYRLAGMERG